MFSWFVGSIWGAKMREKWSGIPVWIKTRFCDDFGSVLGVIWHPKIDGDSIEKSIDF